MSKTNKIRQLEKANARLELQNESLIERNTRLSLDNHRLNEEIKMTRQDLEIVKLAYEVPAILQRQAE